MIHIEDEISEESSCNLPTKVNITISCGCMERNFRNCLDKVLRLVNELDVAVVVVLN